MGVGLVAELIKGRPEHSGLAVLGLAVEVVVSLRELSTPGSGRLELSHIRGLNEGIVHTGVGWGGKDGARRA